MLLFSTLAVNRLPFNRNGWQLTTANLLKEKEQTTKNKRINQMSTLSANSGYKYCSCTYHSVPNGNTIYSGFCVCVCVPVCVNKQSKTGKIEMKGSGQ